MALFHRARAYIKLALLHHCVGHDRTCVQAQDGSNCDSIKAPRELDKQFDGLARRFDSIGESGNHCVKKLAETTPRD